MLLMLCLATAKKLGHHVSLSLECKGLHHKMEYRKKPILPAYTVKIVQLPQPAQGEDMGALFLDPAKYGEGFERNLAEWYANVFDKTFDPNSANPNPAYESFKDTVKVLFDLIDDKKYDKAGNHSASYKHNQKDAWLSEKESEALYQYFQPDVEVGRLSLGEKVTYTRCPEGLTLRSRIMDEAVFESADKIKIVVGPRQNSWTEFKVATTVDDLNLSADFLIRAGIVSQIAGNGKNLELIVVGTSGITEADIRKKVDAIVRGDSYASNVQAASPQEVNVAMMGSVGMSAAYHYHTRNFIFTARSGLDHTWGKFRQTAPKGIDTENNQSLGFGGYVGAGVDYKWAKNVALGLEAGVRMNQLKIPQIKDPVQKVSMWFTSPYAQVNCTFFSEDNASLGLFSGYVFAKEFTVKSTGTRIPYGSACSIAGLYGGFRLSKYL